MRRMAHNWMQSLVWVGGMLLPAALYAMEDARVLPQGRFRMSWGHAQTGAIREEFSADGVKTSLLDPYQLKLDSKNLRTYDSGLSDLIDILNSTGVHFDSSKTETASRGVSVDPQKPLLGDALDRGFLEIEGSGARTVEVLSLQYGITDRLSLGLVVPWVKTRVRFTAELVGSNTAAQIYAAFVVNNPELLGSFNEIPSALALIGEGGIETLQQLLIARGYDRVEPSQDEGLGDLGIGGRWNWLKTQEQPGVSAFMGSLQASLTAPTGELAGTRELARFDRGYGTYDFAIAQVWNYQPSRFLTFSMGLHASNRLKSSRLKRIQNSAADLLPDESTEQKVDVQWGGKRWWTLGARINPSDFLSFQIGYENFEKATDQYQGSGSPDSYTYLSDGTSSRSETAQVGVSLSSVPRFLSGSFPIPGDLGVTYYWNTNGVNALVNRYALAEVALYF